MPRCHGPACLNGLLLVLTLCATATVATASPPPFENLRSTDQAALAREAENWLLIDGQLWSRELLLRWENQVSRLAASNPKLPFEETDPPYYYNPVTEQATHDLLIAAGAGPNLLTVTGQVQQVTREGIVVRQDNQRVNITCDPAGYERGQEVHLLVRTVEPDTQQTDARGRPARSSRNRQTHELVNVQDYIQPLDAAGLYQAMLERGIAESPYFRPERVWIERPQSTTQTVQVSPNLVHDVITTTEGEYRWEWNNHPRPLRFMQGARRGTSR